MTRRRFIQRSAFGAAALGLPLLGHMRWLAPFQLQLRRERVVLPSLAPDAPPVRIAHLSDLHSSGDVPDDFLLRAFDMALAEKPDVVCLTGDFVTNGVDFAPDRYSRLLRRISDRVPAFATMGNHDGGAWSGHFESSEPIQSVLRNAGIEVLHNRAHTFQARSGGRVELVGLGDAWALEFSADAAFAQAAPSSPTLPRIVLSHNPDTKSSLERHDWQLMLAGHTHGGQIVLPWYGPIWVPVEDLRYLVGVKPWKDRLIQVTSGVGNVAGFRLNCPPEVVLLEIMGPRPN